MRRDGLPTLAWLVVAALAISISFGLARFWITSPSGAEPDSQKLLALVIHVTVFLVGGIAAVLTTLFLVQKRPDAGARLTAVIAVVGNAPSGLLALVILRVFIWDTPSWLATALAAYGAGCVVFFLVLLLRTRPAAPVVDRR